MSKCCGLTFTIEKEKEITFSVGNLRVIETGNYNKLINKPSINDVVLEGNKTFEELGDHTLTNIDIKSIFDRVFRN